MLQLKLFGVPTLERDGVQLAGRASQRHRLALLALLALAPGRRLTRDKLIAYLWPESDPERGRNLLKVATYVIRSALDENALLSSGDELRLNTDLIQVDVAEFEAALDQSDHERAVTLHQGPFLDGFFVSDAPEFEHWVDRERERLAGGYRSALEGLADAASNAGDLPKALDWWKVRAAQDPYDSRVALRLMQAYEASGNRAGALQHASIHHHLLHEEFGMAASAEIAALAERLRTEPDQGSGIADRERIADRGSRIAETAIEVRESGIEAEVSRIEDRAAAIVPRTTIRDPRSSQKRWVAALALLAVVTVAGAAVTVWPRGADPERSIVVLPFVNISGAEENEYFSDGLTEEIITRLAAVPSLKVISRTSAMHYKGSKKPLPQIARELKVDHILEGSVRLIDGQVRISAQLIDARVDGHLWAENYEPDLGNGFRVQEQIAREVANALEMRLRARERRLIAKRGTRDPEAYRLYQRGRFLWNTRTREGHERAIEYYQQAIERDSGYADAYAGMADAYVTAYQLNLSSWAEQEVYDRMKWAAERALALDDESADAHTTLAVAHLWQKNWPGAGREFLRAIELNPGNATAHTWYSLLLRAMSRSEESLRESRRAAELDPLGVVPNHNYAMQCYIMRDYDCAIEQFRRGVEFAPYPGAYRGLGLVYVQKKMFAEAIASVRKAIELAPERPDFVADLAYVQALAGHTADARTGLNQAKTQPIEGFNIARAYVALGEPDSAFVWLDRANWHFGHRAARADPGLDPLRSDPRFAELVRRVDRAMGMK